MKNKTFLAIIPARQGSKRLKNKNLKELQNKPLIAYTIEASIQSKYINKTIVSSDSSEIISTAKEYGACSPFVRPKELAQDNSKSIDVVTHTIKYLREKEGASFDYILLLQPTSPLRDNIDIDKAIEYLFEKNADAIISVCETEHNPLWSNILNKTKSMKNFLDDKYINMRSQDLDKYFRLNGAIYICKTDILLKENTFFIKDNIFAFEMTQQKSVDIDSNIDFLLANAILEDNKCKV